MNRSLWILFGFVLAVFFWSAVNPHDYFTWILEVAPAIVAAVILFYTRKKFPLTKLVYILICIHAMILMIGGHYTYAEVPLGRWMQSWFDFERNHYDRIGHVAQGFIPAIVAREILVRTSPLKKGAWLFIVCCSICLSISAFYEMIEWWVALLSETASEAFLGTQGDVWDTQSDMLMALIGAMAALTLLGRLHHKQINRLIKKIAH